MIICNSMKMYYSEEELNELRRDYERRRLKGVNISLFFILALIIMLPLLLGAVDERIGTVLFLAVSAIFLYQIIKLKTNTCPICNKNLGRTTYNAKYCPCCGERYRL